MLSVTQRGTGLRFVAEALGPTPRATVVGPNGGRDLCHPSRNEPGSEPWVRKFPCVPPLTNAHHWTVRLNFAGGTRTVMTQRANGSSCDRAEDASGRSLDAGWDEVPESSAIPVTAAPRTLPPTRTASESRTVSATTIPPAVRSSVLPPVTIAPRPRPSTRVPASTSLRPLSIGRRNANATDGTGPTAVGGLGASDDPTLEVSFQFLEEALFDLVEGSGPSEDPGAEDPDAEDPDAEPSESVP